jgi:hypothetical protein
LEPVLEPVLELELEPVLEPVLELELEPVLEPVLELELEPVLEPVLELELDSGCRICHHPDYSHLIRKSEEEPRLRIASGALIVDHEKSL